LDEGVGLAEFQKCCKTNYCPQITLIKRRKMSIKVLVRSLFAIWTTAVAALSILSHPGSKDLLMSVKLTSSGFVMHGIAYFAGILLCYFSFNKKDISFVLWAGLLIFIYSVVLEVVQFYLPYRTFNVYDVVGNGVGILLFVFIWVMIYGRMHVGT
jgi:hypothetical protein